MSNPVALFGMHAGEGTTLQLASGVTVTIRPAGVTLRCARRTGDAISFLQDVERITLAEALARLTAKAGNTVCSMRAREGTCQTKT